MPVSLRWDALLSFLAATGQALLKMSGVRGASVCTMATRATAIGTALAMCVQCPLFDIRFQPFQIYSFDMKRDKVVHELTSPTVILTVRQLIGRVEITVVPGQSEKSLQELRDTITECLTTCCLSALDRFQQHLGEFHPQIGQPQRHSRNRNALRLHRGTRGKEGVKTKGRKRRKTSRKK